MDKWFEQYKDSFLEFFPPAPTTEVGGDHYMRLFLQPIQLSMALGVDALTFNVIKYLSRAPYKNGVEDYRKAVQYLEFLMFYKVQQRINASWYQLLGVYCYVNEFDQDIEHVLQLTFYGRYEQAIDEINGIISKSGK